MSAVAYMHAVDYINYLQLLCKEIIEFFAKYHERSEGYFAGQIGRGNPR